MSASERDPTKAIEPALRPQFGLRTLALALATVSLTFALARWLPPAIVLAILFVLGLVALHLFSTALGKKLRASRPDERTARKPSDPSALSSSTDRVAGSGEPCHEDGELRERRAVASRASWTAALVAGTLLGAACGWSYVSRSVADVRVDDSLKTAAPAAGLAAFGFLGAVAGGLGHAFAASLFVAHRQSVKASEAKGP